LNGGSLLLIPTKSIKRRKSAKAKTLVYTQGKVKATFLVTFYLARNKVKIQF
jgi:hypothetical protein